MAGEFDTLVSAKAALLAYGCALVGRAYRTLPIDYPQCMAVALMQAPELREGREGSHIAPELAAALEAALAAGACRRAAVLNPDSRMTWLAVAEAKRRDALGHLREWAASVATPVGRSRA